MTRYVTGVSASPLRLSLMGVPAVHVGGTPARFRYRKTTALLLLLATEPRPHPRDHLLHLLWGDRDERKARNHLRLALTDLRGAVGDRLITDRRTVQLDPHAHVALDLDRFRAWARTGAHAGDPIGADLLGGPFLDGFHVKDAPAFDAWVEATREALAEEVRDAFVLAADAAADDDRRDDAVTLLHLATQHVPWDEDAHLRLVRTLAALGRRDAALRQVQRCRDAVRAHLDAAPSPALDALAAQLRDGAPDAHAPVPFEATPFVGRHDLLARVEAALAAPDVDLVTLVGPPGIGTSRLLREALRRTDPPAAALRVVVDAGGVRDAGELAHRIDAALDAAGVPATPGDGAVGGRALHRIAARVRGLALQLAIDDLPPDVARAASVGALLAGEPGLTGLVATRAPFGLLRERAIRVPHLPLPDVDAHDPAAAEADPTVTLMRHAAQAHGNPVTVDAGNARSLLAAARRLHGHPVAALLAGRTLARRGPAAFLGTLEHAAEPLRDGPADLAPRHRSLAETYAPLLATLDADERALVDAWTVLDGPAPVPALRAVAAVAQDPPPHDAPPPDDAALEARLEALAARHVVSPEPPLRDGTPRYALAPGLALVAGPDAPEALRERARGAMACHYADLLDATRERTFGREGDAALADLQPELENVDAALDHLVARDPAYALPLLARTWRVMASLGHAGAALGRLRPLLDAHGDDLPDAARADALDAAGSLAFNVGRRAEARRFYAAALPLRRALDDPARLAWTLINLNTLLVILGDWDAAAATFREVLDAGERAGPAWMNAASLQNISWVATAGYDEALTATRTSLADAVRAYADAGDALTEIGARLALNDLLIRGDDATDLLANLAALDGPLARLDATDRARVAAPLRGAIHLLEAFDRHDAAERLEALAGTHLP